MILLGMVWREERFLTQQEAKRLNKKGNESINEAALGQSNFFQLCVHLQNLSGNLSKRTLSNTTPLNIQNSEIVHFCNHNDNDHRKKIDNPYYSYS